MTHHPSRKEFVARLLGVTAFLGFFPKLFAKSAAVAAATPEASSRMASGLPFAVRTDARAVARRADTV